MHTIQAAVVAWQIGEYQKSIAIDTGTNTFWDIFGILVGGALVPLIVGGTLSIPQAAI